MVCKIDTGKESHLKLLSDAEKVFELYIHNVKPKYNQDYFQSYKNWSTKLESKDKNAKLIGKWKVEVVDQNQYNQDQYEHIWLYDGWRHASSVLGLQQNDFTLNALLRDQEPFLRLRQNQFPLSFSIWPSPKPQTHNEMHF